MKTIIGKLFPITFLAILVFSCKNEPLTNQIAEINSPILRNSSDPLFYNIERTQEILLPLMNKFTDGNSFYHSSDQNYRVLLEKVQLHIKDMDNSYNDQYTLQIMNKIGLPLWNGGLRFSKDNDDDEIIMIPLISIDNSLINGFLIYSESLEGQEFYQIKSLTEISENISNLPSSLRAFYGAIFESLDSYLFDSNFNYYDNWTSDLIEAESLVCAVNEVCFLVPFISGWNVEIYELCFPLCTEGCYSNLLLYDIADTEEEVSWIFGNCDFASVINVFIEENTNNTLFEDVANALLEIGVSNSLSFEQFNEITFGIEAFIQDPNSETNAENLYNVFASNGLDILAISPFALTSFNNSTSYDWPGTDWIDFNGPDYFGLTNSLRQGLQISYPTQAAKIDNWWGCRVLGPAHEVSSLNALGLPQNNQLPLGFNRKPDGYLLREVSDGFSVVGTTAVFIEVKGKFAGNTFDYSNQQGQLDDYLSYLGNPSNIFMPSTMINHGLFLILPANISLSQDVIDLASNNNTPILTSGVEYTVGSTNEFRIKEPELLNISSLNYSFHLLSFLGDGMHKWAIEENIVRLLDFQETEIEFQSFADAFENSYLIPNDEPIDCADD